MSQRRHPTTMYIVLSAALTTCGGGLGPQQATSSQPAAGSRPSSTQPCRSVDEVQSRYEFLTKPAPGIQEEAYRDVVIRRERLGIIQCLDSDVPEVQLEASRILATSPWRGLLPPDMFAKYLDKKYPLPVRVAALIRSMQLTFWEGDHDSYAAKMKDAWARCFNEVMSLPMCPPYFEELMYGGQAYRIVVTPENQRMLLRRALTHGWTVSDMVSKEILVKEVLEWYPTATDPEIRYSVLSRVHRAVRTIMPDMEKLGEMAKGDWEPRCAETGLEILAGQARAKAIEEDAKRAAKMKPASQAGTGPAK